MAYFVVFFERGGGEEFEVIVSDSIQMPFKALKAWLSPVATDNSRRSLPGGPDASAINRRRTKICANKNRIRTISTTPSLNMDRIFLLEYFAS